MNREKYFFIFLFFYFLNINLANSNPDIKIHNKNYISIDFTSRIPCNYRLEIAVPYINFANKDPFERKEIPVNIDFILYQDGFMIKSLNKDKLTLLSAQPSKKIAVYGIYASEFNNGLALNKGSYKIKIFINYLPKELLGELKWSLHADSASILGCFAFFR